MAELQNLPPGWDCIFDEKSGKYYYINHYTRMTTWDDPRSRHRPLHHGTSKHFPGPPLEHIPLQDMKPKISWTVKSSPKLTQDTSISVTTESEDIVAKIALMFPTVPETHIKMLLKKYHERDALVISALQVEKYPITTPGPFATPPPQMRGLRDTPPLGATRATVSCRSSPRTQSSPKLKLRYMKSIFPTADETVILDVLQNNENSIQKTAENLTKMGFAKKDTVKIAQQKMEAKKEEKKKEEETAVKPLTPVMKVKSDEEKKKMKNDLQAKYKDVPQHLITIALESVNFNEDRANQILQIMIQEDTQNSEAKKTAETQITVVDAGEGSATKASIPISQSRQSIKSLMKAEKDMEKITYCRVVEESEGNFVSKNLLNTSGPNHSLAKGANEKLLLEDYVKWQGPNPSLRRGSSNLAKGPNKHLLSNRTYQACGPNKDLRKGPECGLAKGSVFAQLKSMVIGDSRVK
ncbi:unnamed protein product [Acanthoscelides obtectus]|uniref:WW domain-containing protein n=1 Tax=Acanthoscelides obtectus TaxID=200917 RepID=A0A9P0KTR3_ACAOB|nr:unnamed protein product [Acanthoscelides obtectus]CAK1639238.1 hypothetical protein AOBTE_LOCUS11061 [Acanthoscelides obtectus]